ncbi:MAG TPA: hypothetical protein VD969_14990 [Symbiobacteriaceae bacterium]|nr:hypothetical protein [Symbiobacteriaceae bacterium]
MAEQRTPSAGASAARQAGAGNQPFDLQRFGVEVASEIGVDPNNLGAYGLSEQSLRQYETQLHSRTQRGGSR